MNSLSCFAFLLVISAVFCDPLLNLNVGLSLGGGGGGGGGYGDQQQSGCARCLDGAKDETDARQEQLSGWKEETDGAEDKINDDVDGQRDGAKDKVSEEVDEQENKLDNSQKQDEQDKDTDNDQKQDEESKETGIPEFETSDKLEYRFFPVSNGEVRFELRAPTDCHLAFTTKPVDDKPIIEIIISGFGNSRSVIRKNKVKSPKADQETPSFLSANEFRGFRVTWDRDSGSISVFRENEDTPFISWVDPEPIEFNYIGISTGYGAKGTWRMKGNDMFPGNEVDKDGNRISTSS